MSTTKHSYCVYILGSLSGTLYIGFTGIFIAEFSSISFSHLMDSRNSMA